MMYIIGFQEMGLEFEQIPILFESIDNLLDVGHHLHIMPKACL